MPNGAGGSKSTKLGLKEIIDLSSTFITAIATAYIAYYTVQLSNSGEKAINRSDENSKIQLRPYVIQDLVKYTNYDISLAIRNVGQTPAIEVTSNTRAMITSLESINKFLNQGIDEDLTEVDLKVARFNMGPNGNYEVSPPKVPNKFTDGNFKNISEFSDQDIAGFLSGKLLYWVSGAIRYKDIYGEYHRTRFCYYFEKKIEVRMYCYKNNDIQ